MLLLECCTDSVESAIEAQTGGANRLELCANLIIGGTTPDIHLFHAVRQHTRLPIHVLIRPRFGDFCYTEHEFAIMCADVRMFRDAGAEGVVIGLLTPDGSLDVERLATLIAQAEGMHITLHRAFDVCRDPFEALEQARTLGVHTILTSGQKNSSLAGKDLLRELVLRAENLTIMVGSGVTPDNIVELATVTGAGAYHMSCKQSLDSPMRYRKEEVSMGLPLLSEYVIWRTSAEAVARVRRSLDAIDNGRMQP